MRQLAPRCSLSSVPVPFRNVLAQLGVYGVQIREYDRIVHHLIHPWASMRPSAGGRGGRGGAGRKKSRVVLWWGLNRDYLFFFVCFAFFMGEDTECILLLSRNREDM